MPNVLPPSPTFSSTSSTLSPPPPSRGPVNEHLLSHLRVGDELDLWWPLDRQYYPGRIAAALPNGYHRIEYDDGDVERLYLPAEQWRFTGNAADRVTEALRLAPRPQLKKKEKHVVTEKGGWKKASRKRRTSSRRG